jgi:AmpD protein
MRLDADSGWLEDAARIRSPNCDARPPGAAVDLLVIHGISLPPGCYGGGYVDRLFTNTLDPAEHPYFGSIAGQRVSAHVLIDRQGRLTQYVSFRQRAWHAGKSSFQGRDACNDYSIGIELEGCDEDNYTGPQYIALVELSRLLLRYYPRITPDRIVGHCHIAPGRKTDPGPRFDWPGYFHLLYARQ